MSSLLCRVTSCDLDDCGVCRRCGSESLSRHEWKEAERNRPCFRRKVCSGCRKENEVPDHDWQTSGASSQLKCARCGLSI